MLLFLEAILACPLQQEEILCRGEPWGEPWGERCMSVVHYRESERRARTRSVHRSPNT